MNNYILKNEERLLRPVTVEDAEFIVKLRNQAHVKGFVHDTDADVEKQRQWIFDYLKRENEYYWIHETLDGTPYATSSLYHYHYDAGMRQIESGRWVRMSNAPETNLFAGRVQMHDFVFSVLGIDRLVYDVVSTNKQVLRYQRMCGAVETGVEFGGAVIANQKVDFVWFEETPESWAKVRTKICSLAGIDPLVPYGEIIRI